MYAAVPDVIAEIPLPEEITLATYGRLFKPFPPRNSAFRLLTWVIESTVNGDVEPEVPPLNAGIPKTTGLLALKLKYEGADAAQIGSASASKKEPVTVPADIILPFISTDKIGIIFEAPYVPETTPEFARFTKTFPGPVPVKDIPVPAVIEVTAYDDAFVGVNAYEPMLFVSTKIPVLPSKRFSSDAVKVAFIPSKTLSSTALDVTCVPDRYNPAKLGESDVPRPSVVLAVAPLSTTHVVPFPTIIFESAVDKAAKADKLELDG